MKKILLSLLSIGAVAGVAVLATGAFFSDTETSKDNILQAGALDLKVDNTCYYNGNACVDGEFQGTGEECTCNWTLKDLDDNDVFFSFDDLKPGDWEEDTISLHVDNPSWVCAQFKLTKNDDFSCTTPELLDDSSCTDPFTPGDTDAFDGELAQNLHFVFWYDDGNNVLERGEQVIQLGQGNDVLGASWAIADHSTGSPIPAGQTIFIGKAFCYGELGLAPKDPADTNNSPLGPITNSGITCDGKPVNNASQTDLAEGDVVFQAVQARHNESFLCESAPPPISP